MESEDRLDFDVCFMCEIILLCFVFEIVMD